MNKFYAAALFILLLVLPIGASGNSDSIQRTISVAGSSAITVPAENATIHAQLKVVSDSVENSYRQVMDKLVALTEKMQQFGLEKADITVSAITQGAEYSWTANTRKLAGYSATCSLQLKVDQLQDSYKIHNELSAFPELTILRTEYGLNDYSKIKAQTLQQAILDAKNKAEVMAKTLDGGVSQVLTINEVGSQPMPMARSEAMMHDAAGAPNPINVTTHGTVTVNSHVSAVFELE